MKSSVPSTKPPGDGWLPWDTAAMKDYGFEVRTPLDFLEVETWRAGWMRTKVEDPWRLDPLRNIHGLYWRPASLELTTQEKVRRHWTRIAETERKTRR